MVFYRNDSARDLAQIAENFVAVNRVRLQHQRSSKSSLEMMNGGYLPPDRVISPTTQHQHMLYRKAFMEITPMAPLKETPHVSIAPPILNRRGSCQQVVGALVQRPSDEGLIKVG